MASLRRFTVLVGFHFLMGCSTTSTGAAPTGTVTSSTTGTSAPASSIRWVRSVQPFDVLDIGGIPYSFPFLGGFSAPRPQLVDIDSDGDVDVFVQDVSDQLHYFQRDDAGGAPRYSWRPEVFAGLSIGEWYRFADVDGDGDWDLLAEEPFSYVRLYRNSGPVGSPRFVLVGDTLRDDRGAPIFSDRQNIPNAADLDCDGMLDLLIGRLAGTITRYEATGLIGANAAPFRHLTDRFEGIEILGDPAALPRPPGLPSGGFGPRGMLSAPGVPARGMPTMRHGANTMALADIDSDGDVDLVWGDFFEAGLLFIENTAACPRVDLSSQPRPLRADPSIETSGYNAPTFGDTDGDGDLDLLMGVLGGAFNPNATTASNLYHFVQDEGGVFRLASERFIHQIDVGSESIPSLLDLDSDGDLDLLVGNRVDPDDVGTAHIYWFENLGDSSLPRLRARGRLPIEGAYHNAPAFGDLDGDGDQDLVLGTWQDELMYFENSGGPGVPGFELVDPAVAALTRGSNATPTLGDIDDDGDLDLIVGESAGTLSLYLNSGTQRYPRFELVSDEFLRLDVGRRSFPKLLDLDGDDDLDLAVGAQDGDISYFENQGDVSAPEFTQVGSPFPAPTELPTLVTPTFGDVDGDGDMDMVTGGLGGGVYFYERR